MGARNVGERRPPDRAPSRWALIVCAATIVLAIGGPLVGRGIFIGTSVVNTQLPWSMEAPASYWNRLPPVFDTVDIGAPARTLIRETLVNDHRLALWDPYANGGTPLGSHPSTGILAPINWPLLLLGVKTGTAWAGFLRLAVAAAGMFFLLRRLRLSRFAGVCGGLIYCTSGFIVSWNNWPQADLAALIPLLFLTADRLLERRRALDLAAMAAVVAAMLLEGYPPLFIATFYALGGFLLVRWWELDRARGGDHRSARDTGPGGIQARVALGGCRRARRRAHRVPGAAVPHAHGCVRHDVPIGQRRPRVPRGRPPDVGVPVGEREPLPSRYGARHRPRHQLLDRRSSSSSSVPRRWCSWWWHCSSVRRRV